MSPFVPQLLQSLAGRRSREQQEEEQTTEEPRPGRLNCGYQEFTAICPVCGKDAKWASEAWVEVQYFNNSIPVYSDAKSKSTVYCDCEDNL